MTYKDPSTARLVDLTIVNSSMTRAWEIFAPMCWNAFEDPGGLSRKAGNLLAAAEPQIYENVFVKKTYLMHACSLICLCVIVSAAKPLVLGPLGRVSWAVLSLIGQSGALHHCLARTLSQRFPLC